MPKSKLLSNPIDFIHVNYSRLKKTIDVYTGTYGILEYANVDDKMKNIFLYTANSKTWIPAPHYYWKVVHNKDTNEAVAFIGVNDPQTAAWPKKLCSDVCSSLSWVDWDVTSQNSGYMYCCDVQELKKTISFLPDLCSGAKCPGLMSDQKSATETPTVEAPAQINGCTINLDKLKGKYPPMLVQNGHFLYPEVKNQDGDRVITIGTIQTANFPHQS